MSSPKSEMSPGMSLGAAEEIYGLMAALDRYTDLLGPSHLDTLDVASKLAIAFWCAGETGQAIGLLDQVLDRLSASSEPQHPMRIDVLTTLGEILFEQKHLEQAGAIWREVVAWRVRYSGANHPNSLEAKGDLAAVLFALGLDAEAGCLEQEAFESARTHLGKTHPVTSFLAWNRALSYERYGDLDSARRVIVSELVWLLAEDPSSLEAGQNTVRTLLSKRLNWDAAIPC
jgi:tetratricopeptide (TPR) repeat protein